jgi:hypothetical protein
MKKNCSKVTKTCGTRNFASCIDYEGEVNENSEFTNQDCLNVEDNIQDIYNQLEDINLSELGQECLEYTQEEGRIKVKAVLLKYEQEICELKTKVTELENRPLCNMPLGSCVDTTGLVDPCGDPITTFGQLLQLLINNDIP